MIEKEFEEQFGMKPERCKQIMESIKRLVNREVHEVIEHADYYINPTDYCPEEYYGKLEKDEESDGYTCLYDIEREHSAEEIFKEVISLHTRYGGHRSAIQAVECMGLEWGDEDA